MEWVDIHCEKNLYRTILTFPFFPCRSTVTPQAPARGVGAGGCGGRGGGCGRCGGGRVVGAWPTQPPHAAQHRGLWHQDQDEQTGPHRILRYGTPEVQSRAISSAPTSPHEKK